jgi:hypothetical protein
MKSKLPKFQIQFFESCETLTRNFPNFNLKISKDAKFQLKIFKILLKIFQRYQIFRKFYSIFQVNFLYLWINVWLKWKILLDPGKWHIFWSFGPYWVQKYPFRRDRWKIRRWWVISPRHLPNLLILHKFFQSCNLLVIIGLFDSLHRNLLEK